MTEASAASSLMRQDPLLSLAARLQDPVDRESYAELVVWLRSLPPHDEMVKLARLLGFLTLIARDLPGALATEATELRELSQTNAAYHCALQERLSKFPEEIAERVNPEELAEAMSESFRQQLSATALEDTGRLLGASIAGLTRLSSDLASAVKPLTNQYPGISTTISAELAKLTNSSTELRRHNAGLIAQASEERWQWKALFCILLLFCGFLFGLTWEKRRTSDLIADLETQMVEIQKMITARPPPTEGTALPQRPRRSTK
jgi:hypothetical protein